MTVGVVDLLEMIDVDHEDTHEQIRWLCGARFVMLRQVLLPLDEQRRLWLQDLLHENGYKVLTAVDGTGAVSLFTEQKDLIDLVLTDVGLPGLSGEEVFRAIRKIKPDIKVVLASGYLDTDLHSALIRDGVADVIQKPYQFIDLLQRIRQALDSDLT